VGWYSSTEAPSDMGIIFLPQMNANERKSVAKDHMIFFGHGLRGFSRIVSFLIPWRLFKKGP